MKKEVLDKMFDGSPGRKRLAETMADPLKVALKRGRFGACIDCGMDIRGAVVHPEDECLVRAVLGS